MDTRGSLYLVVKWLGCEADHSPPPCAKVKNVWHLHPQYVFMAWCLLKYMDNFTFTFTIPILNLNVFHIYNEIEMHQNVTCSME